MRQPPRASRPNSPGYGIVGENEGEGLLPWPWAVERLTAGRNYFLATTRPDGRPHVMVVWGVWMDDAFYFSTGRGSRKARNLVANPRCVVALEVDGDDAVIVEGVAVELVDADQLGRLVAEYQKKYAVDVGGMGEPVFVVTPRVVFAQKEKTFTKSATRWQFD